MQKVRAVAEVPNIPAISKKRGLLDQLLHTDYVETAGIPELDGTRLRHGKAPLTVTTRDVDQQVRELSKVVGYGVNWALQELEIEEINALLA